MRHIRLEGVRDAESMAASRSMLLDGEALRSSGSLGSMVDIGAGRGNVPLNAEQARVARAVLVVGRHRTRPSRATRTAGLRGWQALVSTVSTPSLSHYRALGWQLTRSYAEHNLAMHVRL